MEHFLDPYLSRPAPGIRGPILVVWHMPPNGCLLMQTQAAQAAVCADFAQKFAAAVKQEALQSSHRQFEHAVGNSSLKNAAARAPSKSGGEQF